jgi:hypothetical protein
MTIMVLDSLSQVDITAVLLTGRVAEVSAEDWNLATALNVESNILSGVGELFVHVSCDLVMQLFLAGRMPRASGALPAPSQWKTPIKSNVSQLLLWKGSIAREHTVAVTNVTVQVHLGLTPFTVLGAEAGSEDVLVLDADIFGGEMERHFELDV